MFLSLRHTHRILATGLALAVWSGTAPATTPLDAIDGTGLIRGMGHSVMSLLNSIGPKPQREEQFRAVYRQNFDNAGIVAWVVGRPWQQATPGQRQELLTLFETYVVKSLVVQLADLAGGQLKVLQSEPDGDGVAVSSQLVRPKGNINVKWRLRQSAGTYKVRDVAVEDVSMVMTQRREFAALHQQRGSTVDGLIAGLRDKIAMLDRKSSHAS